MNQALNNTLQNLRMATGATVSRVMTIAMRGELWRVLVVFAVAAGLVPVRLAAPFDSSRAQWTE